MNFSSQTILVLGDVMIDRYLGGKVERISPEAPVPVMLLGEEENRLGGAANVALNLKALGATPLLAGLVGDDANGKVFRDLMEMHGLSTKLIITDPGRCTTVKTRLVASGQQLMRVDREDTHDVQGAAAGALQDAVNASLVEGSVDLLLFQDYNKGVLSAKVIENVIAFTKAYNIPTAVDPKDRNFMAFAGCNLFKPNLREIQQQVDFEVRPVLADLDRAATVLFDRLRCSAVMITLSEHGIYVSAQNTSAIYPTDARKVRDVSGAGDTVIAVAACGLAAGMSLEEIAKLSNKAGAQVIAKSGVVAVNLSELVTDLLRVPSGRIN